MWPTLMNRLSWRSGRLTLFGRWYLGYEIGPLPKLTPLDEPPHACNTPYGPTCWCEKPTG